VARARESVVALTENTPLPRTRLLRSQSARRTRVLTAVLELAHGGGYDAIQLRPVSELSEVGLDTIYRYFKSRDQLISEAVSDWLRREYFEPAPEWPQGDTAAERLLALYQRSWQVWERNPRMLETFVRAALAEGDTESGLAMQSVRAFIPISLAILDEVEPEYRADVLTIASHIYHSAMTSVLRGQTQFDEIYAILERTVRRLAQHPAMAGQRPASWDYVSPDSAPAPSAVVQKKVRKSSSRSRQ
jgi:AcrR family transcriptional regulator